MFTPTFFIIWSLGIVPGYLAVKYALKGMSNLWTIRDRKFALFFSLFSWIMFIPALSTFIVTHLSKGSDKPASW